jgi:hypothetical protein
MPIHALKPFNICNLSIPDAVLVKLPKSGKISAIKIAAAIKEFKGTDIISQLKAYPKILMVSPLGSFYFLSGSYLACAGISEAPSNPIMGVFYGTLGAFTMFQGKIIMDLHIGAYIRATNFMRTKGYDRDKAKPYFLTACGRNILKLAAKENGCLKEYMDQYRAENIKWYHGIIPRFWKTKKPPKFMGYL